MRAAGILLPVSSLPSPYGIGSFSQSAKDFVDLLQRAGQTYWQILPLGPTGYGDSPYQAFSAFAGNPYFIDLDALVREGLLEKNEIEEADFGQSDPSHVDYLKLYLNRFTLLGKACGRSHFEQEEAYQRFAEENACWLDDYVLFMGIKDSLGGISWTQWPDALRMRDPQAMEEMKKNTAQEGRLFRFLQYKFMQQWQELKEYAHSRGVKIIGDIPIYVSPDSSDAWADYELFQFDEDHRAAAVAGCPPDAFSADGQLWGNPLYNWDYHEQTGYVWWKRRIAHCLKLYDVVRVDHFRGFDEYYSIPAGDTTAAYGHWEKGPGMKLFEALRDVPGMKKDAIIAEDLGFLTDSVIRLVRDSGFPGMKVLEFAFDSRDTGSGYLPHTYTPNCVVYTGTHDNQTLVSWYGELTAEDRKLADDYMGFDGSTTPQQRNWTFIRIAFESVADTCVIPLQDYLCLDESARLNHPSALGNNWTWRLTQGQIDEELVSRIRRITEITGRLA